MQRYRGKRAYFLLGILLLLVVAGSVLPAGVGAREEPSVGGVVGGWVRDYATGQGVQATVRIGDHVLHTGLDGTIPPATIPFSTPTYEADVVVEAPGYPAWRYEPVELAQSHPVELHVEIGAPAMPPVPTLASVSTTNALDRPPDFINIGRTFNTTCVYPPINVQRIDRVPFMVYVQNVLPYEWISSWPAASLEAGAVAASQFAWSTALIQRKWTRQGYAFDVLDSTCDQVYKDRAANQTFPATDAAIARMWGTILLRDNKLITTYFRNTDERCETTAGADCMGQYGSRDRANEGMNALQILQYYYDPITPTLRLPQDRAVVWERSPDPVVQQGQTQTLSLRLLNVGASVWERSATELRVVDLAASANTTYRSPFMHSSWIDTQRPTQMSIASAPTGKDAIFNFTITVPPSLKPGAYQLALHWQHRDGTIIPTDPPLVWRVTVQPPLTQKVWVPVVVQG